MAAVQMTCPRIPRTLQLTRLSPIGERATLCSGGRQRVRIDPSGPSPSVASRLVFVYKVARLRVQVPRLCLGPILPYIPPTHPSSL